MRNLILILASTLLIGCGARKVNKVDKVEDKTIVEVVIQKDSIQTTNKTEIKYNVENYEISVVPIDSTKEFVVEGKKYFNARILIKKKKDNTLYSNDNKVSKTSLKQSKTVTKETKKETGKTVDKKEAKSFMFYLSLWIMLLLLIIWLYKKFKSKLF
jgi:ABC-type Na+ efflux pump permease subunit